MCEHSQSALHLVVCTKQVKAVELIANHISDVNIKNDFNQTPLDLAIMLDDIVIVNLLKRCGAKKTSELE